MGNDGADAGCFSVDVKQLNLFFRVRFGSPLARRFGENLDRVTIDFFAFDKRVADTAGNGTCARPEAGRAAYS
jgi:hypothetical protein